ncbi:MAG TPA: GntR family transcriptional regulator [Burkholderiaceae bacterium]
MVDITSQFSIVTGSAEPIYRQLAEQVKRRVAAGQWAPGDEMPSVRDLAQALAVNPMTVSKAFSQLESQGVLERRRGLSMVVATRSGPTPRAADRAELLRPTLERAAAEAHQLGLAQSRALALFKTILQETEPEDLP